METKDGGLFFGAGIDTRQFSKDIDKMRKEIMSVAETAEGGDFMENLDDQIKSTQNNLKLLGDFAKETRDHLSQMAPSLGRTELINELNKIQALQAQEEVKLKNLQVAYEKFGAATESAAIRYKELRAEMEQLATAGKENTDEFKKLLAELNKVSKQQFTVDSFKESMKDSAKSMEGFQKNARVSEAVLSDFLGVLGTVTGQTDRLRAIQQRYSNVVRLAVQSENIRNSAGKESIAIQAVRIIQMKAAIQAERLKTKTTIAATVAQRAFNLVAKANPYILLASAVATVAGAIGIYLATTKEATEAQKRFNDAITDGTADAIVQYGLLQEQWRRTNGDLQRQEKFIKDNAAAFNSIGVAIEDVSDAESAFVGNTKQVVAAMLARVRASALQDLAKDAFKDFQKQADEAADRAANTFTHGWQGILARGKNVFERIFNIDTPVEKMKKSWEDGMKFINDSVNEQIKANEILGDLGLLDPRDRDPKPTKAAEKQREIEQKQFSDMLDERRQLWENYYAAVRILGERHAGEIFGDQIEVGSNFVEELQRWRAELQASAELTSKQVDELRQLDDMLNEITGAKSPFEKQREELESSLEGVETYTGRIKILRDRLSGLGDTFDDWELASHIREEIKRVEEERQRMYDKFLTDHKSFTDKLADIDKERTDLLAVSTSASETKDIERYISEKKYNLFIEMLKDKYRDFDRLFTDIESLTRDRLVDFREVFERELESTDDPIRAKKIEKVIVDINRQIDKLDSTPLKELSKEFRNIVTAADEVSRRGAMKRFGLSLKQVSGEFVGVFRDIERGAHALGVEVDSAFGQILKGARETVQGISMLGDGIAGIASGLLTSNPVAIIAGAAQAASGAAQAIGAWIDTNGKSAVAAKVAEDRVKALSSAYRELQFQLSRGFAQNEYNVQRSLVENLRSQIEAIRERIRKEYEKKRTDHEAIDQWNEDIKQKGREIEELIDSIAESMISTDVRSLSLQLGDALVDAFERGADAAESMENVVDNVFKQMVRNWLSAALEPKIKNVFDEILRAQGVDPKTGLPLFPGTSPRDPLGVSKLSPEQIKEFRDQLVGLSDEGTEFLKMYRELFQGILPDEERRDGLRGAIQGMSQETAGILAGQFNAIRMDTSGILTILRNNENGVRNQAVFLSEISSNTGLIHKEIKDLNSKIEKGDIRSSGV